MGSHQPAAPLSPPPPPDALEWPYIARGGGVTPPPLLPFQCLRLTAKSFSSAPSVPGFTFQKFWPPFGGDHRGTLRGGGGGPSQPPPPLIHLCSWALHRLNRTRLHVLTRIPPPHLQAHGPPAMLRPPRRHPPTRTRWGMALVPRALCPRSGPPEGAHGRCAPCLGRGPWEAQRRKEVGGGGARPTAPRCTCSSAPHVPPPPKPPAVAQVSPSAEHKPLNYGVGHKTPPGVARTKRSPFGQAAGGGSGGVCGGGAIDSTCALGYLDRQSEWWSGGGYALSGGGGGL